MIAYSADDFSSMLDSPTDTRMKLWSVRLQREVNSDMEIALLRGLRNWTSLLRFSVADMLEAEEMKISVMNFYKHIGWNVKSHPIVLSKLNDEKYTSAALFLDFSLP